MGNNTAKPLKSKKGSPLISFIVPTYNAASTIRGCLRSITKQNFDDYEIIVVDDGSTDSTKKVVDSFRGGKVAYYHKKNGGVSSARNYGLKKARGDWVIFLDADDGIAPNSLNWLAPLLREEGADFILTPMNSYRTDKNRTGSKEIVERATIIDDIIYRGPKRLAAKIDIERGIGGKAMRRRVIDDNKITFIDGLRLFEDGIFNLQMAHFAKKIIYYDKTFYNYIDNRKSRVNTFYPEIRQDNIVIRDAISNYLKKNHYHSDSFPYLLIELFSSSLFAISQEKTRLRKKVEAIKKCSDDYLKASDAKIKPNNLFLVLRLEYRLCLCHMYRTLLLLCALKHAAKRLRGRI